MTHRLAHAVLRHALAELRRLRRVRGAHRRTARRIARAQALLALGAALLGAGTAGAQPLPPIFLNPWHPFGLKASSAIGHRLAFVDLEADGRVDVLDSFSGALEYYRNLGPRRRPFFASAGSNPFGLVAPGDFAAIAFADIDADGDLDLFAGLPGGTTNLYANTGTAEAPAFAAPVGIASLDVADYAAPSFGDLDGDGDLDALIGDLAGSLVYFANTATAAAPGFTTGQTNPFGLLAPGMFVSPALADLDGDGDLDALVGVYTGTTFLLRNTGTATAPAFASAEGSPLGIEIQAVGPGPALADLDDDGDLDALIADGTGSTVFYRNTGTAAEPAFRHASRAFGLGQAGRANAPEFGDLDGDGDLDALVGHYQGTVFSAPNFGTRSSPEFLSFEANTLGIGGSSYAQPAIADLDGDGDLDVLLGDDAGGGRLLYFVNTGSIGAPAFAAAATNPFCAGSLGTHPTPDFIDLGADGDLDLAMSYGDGRIDVCTNTGTATAPAFGPPETNPFSLPNLGVFASLAFGDVQVNGIVDALVGSNDGTTSVVFNSTSTAAPVFVNFGTDASLGLADLGSLANPTFADLDADGDEDVLIGADDLLGNGRTAYFENLSFDLLCPPAPRTDCAEVARGGLTVDERKPGKERLVLTGKLAAAVTPEHFGEPLESGGSEYGVCLYDGDGARVADLEILRSGELCSLDPERTCWRSLGDKGFAFKDKLGGSAGVTALTLRTTKIAAAASNNVAKGRTALPTGIAALLSQKSTATAQIYVSGGTCVSVALEIKKGTPTLIKARSS